MNGVIGQRAEAESILAINFPLMVGETIVVGPGTENELLHDSTRIAIPQLDDLRGDRGRHALEFISADIDPRARDARPAIEVREQITGSAGLAGIDAGRIGGEMKVSATRVHKKRITIKIMVVQEAG